MTDNNYITSLYSVGMETWRKFLTGTPLKLNGQYVSDLTDELCDGIGGGNILCIDMGEEFLITMPCPAQYAANRTLTMFISRRTVDVVDQLGAFCWVVTNYRTSYIDPRSVQDDPKVLMAALAEFLENEQDADEEADDEAVPAVNLINPFNGDGVQCVIVHAVHWASPVYIVDTTAAAVKERMNEYINEMSDYTDNFRLAYYSTDPCVYGDDDQVIGTDGYPDYVGTYNPTTEEVVWSEA